MSLQKSIEQEFDLSALKVTTNFQENLPIQKDLNIIPVRRPDKQWFIRINENPEFTMDAGILEIKEEGENYIVSPDLIPQLSNEVVIKRLHVAINRQNSLFIWPIRLPNSEGKIDDWNRSALSIAELAKRDWVRVVSNRNIGMYESLIAAYKENIPEPEWPEESFEKIIQAAFKDRIISTLDHIVLKRLRGEI